MGCGRVDTGAVAVASTVVVATATGTPPQLRREMLDSIGAARRFVAAFVERTRRGEGGLAELAAVVELQAATGSAVDAIALHLLTVEDCSYREVGIALGITAQAAAKRYPGASSRPAGGQRAWLR